MIKPALLFPGDKVGILATGKQIPSADVYLARDTFRSWQLEVQLGNNILSAEHSYFAAFDAHRLGDLQEMINDKTIKAIVCARGGYGTTRILDDIDFSPLLETPKWVIGFSDITAIHLKLFKLGIQSIHGIMPILFRNPESSSSLISLKHLLFEAAMPIDALAHPANRPGYAEGPLVGGNLSLLVDSIGTASEPDLETTILVIEEVDEHLYKIDRMLTHLKRSGKLERLAGLVVGHMTAIKDTKPGFGESIEKIITNKLAAYSYPIAFNFPIGHENPNLAWVHGGPTRLSVAAQGSSLTPMGSGFQAD